MKKKIQIIDGKAMYNGQEFCFNYTDKVLTLYPKELGDRWEALRAMITNHFLRDNDDTINVYGETSDGNPIAFIKLKVKSIGRGIYRSYVPAYVIGKCNSIDPLPEIDDFSSIIFRGKCIDSIYNPKRFVKKLDFTKKSKPIIKFNDFKDINSKMIINEDTWNFCVEWKEPLKDKNTVISVNSLLKIKFANLRNLDEIVEYYIRIEKLLGFLNNRKHVIFSEIELHKDIVVYNMFSGKNEKNFVTFLLNINEDDSKEYDLSNGHKQISVLDVNKNLEKLYNEVNENSFINNSLPNNTYDSEHIDINNFVQIASAFEAEFDRTYPKYKATKNKKYKEIKDKVLNFIKECKKGETTKAVKYLDTFYDIIDNLEGTLPEQVCYALNEYMDPISKVKERLFNLYEIEDATNDTLAQALAQKRNYIAHGREIKSFTDIEIVAYILVERLVYCLLLKRVGFSITEITLILEKIFE